MQTSLYDHGIGAGKYFIGDELPITSFGYTLLAEKTFNIYGGSYLHAVGDGSFIAEYGSVVYKSSENPSGGGWNYQFSGSENVTSLEVDEAGYSYVGLSVGLIRKLTSTGGSGGIKVLSGSDYAVKVCVRDSYLFAYCYNSILRLQNNTSMDSIWCIIFGVIDGFSGFVADEAGNVYYSKYLSGGTKQLVCIDANGSGKWNLDLVGTSGKTTVNTWFNTVTKELFACDSVYLWKIDSDGSIVWTHTGPYNYFIGNDAEGFLYLYGTDGTTTFSKLNPTTGEIVLSSTAFTNYNNIVKNGAYESGKLIVADMPGGSSSVTVVKLLQNLTITN